MAPMTWAPALVMSMQEQEVAYPLSIASRAAAAWRSARNSTSIPALWARPLSHKCDCSTHIPPGPSLKRERLSALMGDGGIQECGYAQNCVEACPKEIPLTRSISQVSGEVMKQALGDLFRQ